MSYTILQIPTPPSEADLSKYKNLRLLSLQSDPECFGSNYLREANFTANEWRERLDSTEKATFIARHEFEAMRFELEAEGGDDQVSSSDLEELLPRCAVRTVKANLLKDDILVEVNSVEAIRGSDTNG